jgi:peptidoglycan glycosyltransferase
MPAVKALKFAGIGHTIDLLHRAGITSLKQDPNYYGLALTLGGGEVTPLDLTAAYNTLASGGRYYPPVSILKIVGPDNHVVEQFTPRPQPPALNPDHVAIITNMLSDDKAREPVWGLGSKLKLTRPAAVKTGTSNDWRDAWAVGYTPYVTVGVWTGNNNNEETAKVESLTGGGVIWHNVMEELFADPRFERILAAPYGGKLPLDFELPKTLVRQPICKLPGKFNNFGDDLFTDAMLKAARPARVGQAAPIKPGEAQPLSDGCSLTTKETVFVYGEVAGEDGQTTSSYCRPLPGTVPDSLLITVDVWKLPPPDPSMKVVYRWEGGSASLPDAIPECTPEMLATAPVPPAALEPGAVQMPNLIGLGENQAKEALANLGIYSVSVDYQTRDRIPDVFDRYGPYVVVSTLPGTGEWLPPGATVVLGVRAPE